MIYGDKNTGVLVQGATGKQGEFRAHLRDKHGIHTAGGQDCSAITGGGQSRIIDRQDRNDVVSPIATHSLKMIEQIVIVSRRRILSVLGHKAHASAILERDRLDVGGKNLLRIEERHSRQLINADRRTGTVQDVIQTVDAFECAWHYFSIT